MTQLMGHSLPDMAVGREATRRVGRGGMQAEGWWWRAEVGGDKSAKDWALYMRTRGAGFLRDNESTGKLHAES